MSTHSWSLKLTFSCNFLLTKVDEIKKNNITENIYVYLAQFGYFQ